MWPIFVALAAASSLEPLCDHATSRLQLGPNAFIGSQDAERLVVPADYALSVRRTPGIQPPPMRRQADLPHSGILVTQQPGKFQPLFVVHGHEGDVHSLGTWMSGLLEVEVSRTAFAIGSGLDPDFVCQEWFGPIFTPDFNEQSSASSIPQFLDQVEFVLAALRREAKQTGRIPTVHLAGFSMGGAVMSYITSRFWREAVDACDVTPHGFHRLENCTAEFVQKFPFQIGQLVTVSSPVRYHALPLDLMWDAIYSEMLGNWKYIMRNLKVDWKHTAPLATHFAGGSTDWIVPWESTQLTALLDDGEGVWNNAVVVMPSLDLMSDGADTIYQHHLSVIKNSQFHLRNVAPRILLFARVTDMIERTETVSPASLLQTAAEIIFYSSHFQLSQADPMGAEYSWYVLSLLRLLKLPSPADLTFTSAISAIESLCAAFLRDPACQLDLQTFEHLSPPKKYVALLMDFALTLMRKSPAAIWESDQSVHTLPRSAECYKGLELDLSGYKLYPSDTRTLKETTESVLLQVPKSASRILFSGHSEWMLRSLVIFWVFIDPEDLAKSRLGTIMPTSETYHQHSFNFTAPQVSRAHLSIDSVPTLCELASSNSTASSVKNLEPALFILRGAQPLRMSIYLAEDDQPWNAPVTNKALRDFVDKFQPYKRKSQSKPYLKFTDLSFPSIHSKSGAASKSYSGSHSGSHSQSHSQSQSRINEPDAIGSADIPTYRAHKLIPAGEDSAPTVALAAPLGDVVNFQMPQTETTELTKTTELTETTELTKTFGAETAVIDRALERLLQSKEESGLASLRWKRARIASPNMWTSSVVRVDWLTAWLEIKSVSEAEDLAKEYCPLILSALPGVLISNFNTSTLGHDMRCTWDEQLFDDSLSGLVQHCQTTFFPRRSNHLAHTWELYVPQLQSAVSEQLPCVKSADGRYYTLASAEHQAFYVDAQRAKAAYSSIQLDLWAGFFRTHGPNLFTAVFVFCFFRMSILLLKAVQLPGKDLAGTHAPGGELEPSPSPAIFYADDMGARHKRNRKRREYYQGAMRAVIDSFTPPLRHECQFSVDLLIRGGILLLNWVWAFYLIAVFAQLRGFGEGKYRLHILDSLWMWRPVAWAFLVLGFDLFCKLVLALIMVIYATCWVFVIRFAPVADLFFAGLRNAKLPRVTSHQRLSPLHNENVYVHSMTAFNFEEPTRLKSDPGGADAATSKPLADDVLTQDGSAGGADRRGVQWDARQLHAYSMSKAGPFRRSTYDVAPAVKRAGKVAAAPKFDETPILREGGERRLSLMSPWTDSDAGPGWLRALRLFLVCLGLLVAFLIFALSPPLASLLVLTYGCYLTLRSMALSRDAAFASPSATEAGPPRSDRLPNPPSPSALSRATTVPTGNPSLVSPTILGQTQTTPSRTFVDVETDSQGPIGTDLQKPFTPLPPLKSVEVEEGPELALALPAQASSPLQSQASSPSTISVGDELLRPRRMHWTLKRSPAQLARLDQRYRTAFLLTLTQITLSDLILGGYMLLSQANCLMDPPPGYQTLWRQIYGSVVGVLSHTARPRTVGFVLAAVVHMWLSKVLALGCLCLTHYKFFVSRRPPVFAVSRLWLCQVPVIFAFGIAGQALLRVAAPSTALLLVDAFYVYWIVCLSLFH